jgi:hypothetical protein
VNPTAVHSPRASARIHALRQQREEKARITVTAPGAMVARP